jgi:hypothetical protein
MDREDLVITITTMVITNRSNSKEAMDCRYIPPYHLRHHRVLCNKSQKSLTSRSH